MTRVTFWKGASYVVEALRQTPGKHSTSHDAGTRLHGLVTAGDDCETEGRAEVRAARYGPATQQATGVVDVGAAVSGGNTAERLDPTQGLDAPQVESELPIPGLDPIPW